MLINVSASASSAPVNNCIVVVLKRMTVSVYDVAAIGLIPVPAPARGNWNPEERYYLCCALFLNIDVRFSFIFQFIFVSRSGSFGRQKTDGACSAQQMALEAISLGLRGRDSLSER